MLQLLMLLLLNLFDALVNYVIICLFMQISDRMTSQHLPHCSDADIQNNSAIVYYVLFFSFVFVSILPII